MSSTSAPSDHPKFLLVELANIVNYKTPIPISALADAEFPQDFQQNSTGLWRLTDNELMRLRTHLEPRSLGLGEDPAEFSVGDFWNTTHFRLGYRRLRRRMLRVRMLELYGPRCPFTGDLHPSLDGHRFEIQLGHVYPLALDGPDTLLNTLLMSGLANWAWDEGLISLTTAGRVLVAEGASADTAARIPANRQIEFPKDPRYWPRAEFLERHRDLVFGRGMRAALALMNNTPA